MFIRRSCLRTGGGLNPVRGDVLIQDGRDSHDISVCPAGFADCTDVPQLYKVIDCFGDYRPAGAGDFMDAHVGDDCGCPGSVPEIEDNRKHLLSEPLQVQLLPHEGV